MIGADTLSSDAVVSDQSKAQRPAALNFFPLPHTQYVYMLCVYVVCICYVYVLCVYTQRIHILTASF